MPRPASGPRQGARLPLRRAPLLLLPRFLTGFRLGDLFRLLQKNRFAVDPPFWPRAILASLGAAVTSCLARFEVEATGTPAEEELVEQPVFILGLPRSGTSHLYELLSQSPDLCRPTRFDTFNPHTLLLLRRWGVFSLLQRLPTVRRAMDDVQVGWGSSEEDIIALTILTSSGERLRDVFPRHRALSTAFSGCREAMDLLHALPCFLRKLVFLHRRRVLLKSPGHTSRVRDILQVFPRAKFVMIFRNPTDQLASLAAMNDSGNRFWCSLQWPAARPMEEMAELQGRRLGEYMANRTLIPPDHLVEITYEELIADRAATIARICRKISLQPPPVMPVPPAGGRRHRERPALDARWLPAVRQHYAPVFRAGIYKEP